GAFTNDVYQPLTLDTAQARLETHSAESPNGVTGAINVIASTDWAWADCRTVPFPGTPDPTRVCLKNGVDPTLLYQLVYTAKDPLVLGVGLAATRNEPGSEPGLWWEDYADVQRGRSTAGMLDRCRATATCPKIVETFGATEFWDLRMSPGLIGTRADVDIPLPANVRRYYF